MVKKCIKAKLFVAKICATRQIFVAKKWIWLIFEQIYDNITIGDMIC